MPGKKELFFNTLSFRVFLFFWLTFSLLSIAIFSIPYVDSRTYAPLNGSELSHYQNKIIENIRNKQIARILAGVPVEHLDWDIDETYPVLLSEIGEVFGAKAQEKPFILQFSSHSNDLTNPLKKTFKDKRITGPFGLHLTDEKERSYRLFFIDYVSPQKELVHFISDNPTALVGLLIIISTPLLWWFARSIAKPIRRLQLAAKAVSVGDFKNNPELEAQGLLELRQVGYSFNKMVDALGEQLANQRQLLSSISHELRTPLTRLQLALALLRRRTGDSSEIQRIEMEAMRLESMINDLLLLSRKQLNSHTMREIFPIHQLWEEILDDALFEAEQRNIQFTQHIEIKNPEKYFLNGNQNLLISAVENVIRNALKYTANKIVVRILLHNHNLQIVIDDNGKGLASSEFEKIFQPFYRVDETRTRETGGAGLGLAIVANVVKEHQGKVWAKSSQLGGLCVTITLPLWIAK